jgi:outer membrane protein, heavy metal efflux system
MPARRRPVVFQESVMTIKDEKGLAGIGASAIILFARSRRSNRAWPMRGGLTLLALAIAGPAAFAQIPAPAAEHVAPPLDVLLGTSTAAPVVAVGEAELRAAEGRAAQARARPNPTVRAEVENFLGTRPYTGFRSAETTVSGDLPLELGGKRRARIGAAEAEVSAARARAALSRTDYIRDLTLAYGEAEAAQLRERLEQEHLELARSDARTTRILVDNGREAELRAVQAEAAVQAAVAKREEAAAAKAVALARLAALTGSAATYTAVAGGLLDQGPARRATAAARHAFVAAATADRDAAAARIRAEQVRRQPDISVGIGVRRFEEQGAFAAIGGVSATIPLFDRNRGNVAAARAELSAAEARLQMATLTSQADLRAATAQADAAESRLLAAGAGERASAEAYRLARIGYDSGRIALSEVLSTRRAWVEARERTLDARLARVRASAELARAEGAVR